MLTSGIQIRFPVPCMSAVVVKKYAVLEMAGPSPPCCIQLGKKSCAVCTMAIVGPAARRLHMNMARQMMKAM